MVQPVVGYWTRDFLNRSANSESLLGCYIDSVQHAVNLLCQVLKFLALAPECTNHSHNRTNKVKAKVFPRGVHHLSHTCLNGIQVFHQVCHHPTSASLISVTTSRAYTAVELIASQAEQSTCSNVDTRTDEILVRRWITHLVIRGKTHVRFRVSCKCQGCM